MSTLEGGLADSVLGAQRAFRAILDALANPGTPQPLLGEIVAPAGLSRELALVALTLCDHDTAVWLDPALRGGGIAEWLRFHAGVRIVDAPSDAAFAFSETASQLLPLSSFAPGTDEYPDRSTTIVLSVPDLSSGARHVARGPGIDGSRVVSPTGLPGDFPSQWSDNRALFPRGIDLLLCAPGQIMGLPRSTRIASEG